MSMMAMRKKGDTRPRFKLATIATDCIDPDLGPCHSRHYAKHPVTAVREIAKTMTPAQRRRAAQIFWNHEDCRNGKTS